MERTLTLKSDVTSVTLWRLRKVMLTALRLRIATSSRYTPSPIQIVTRELVNNGI